MRISQAAFDLIVAEEVSSRAVYEKRYTRPEWPGVQSGATVGIGYDLGHTAQETINADWRGRIPQSMLDFMISASGATGIPGKVATARIRDHVNIPWDIAIAVHKECVLPRWEDKVRRALPNCDKLSPDSFGALVSLTFNRGPSFNNPGDRYKEMRNIKAYMANGSFALIPGEFRDMKRIWPDVPGLLKRRDREAALFERGLKAPIVVLPPDIEPVDPKPKAPPKGKDVASGGSVLSGIVAALNMPNVATAIACVVAGVVVAVIIHKFWPKGQ